MGGNRHLGDRLALSLSVLSLCIELLRFCTVVQRSYVNSLMEAVRTERLLVPLGVRLRFR